MRLAKWIFASYMAVALFCLACWGAAQLLLHGKWWIALAIGASIWAIPQGISKYREEKEESP